MTDLGSILLDEANLPSPTFNVPRVVGLFFTVVVTRPGDASSEITPVQESMKFTTVAVGGFGQCSFDLNGDRRREFPPMSVLRVFCGTALAWEGRVEDWEFAPADDPVKTTVTAYGFQRLLTDVTVRRVWSKRDFPLIQIPGGDGASLAGIGTVTSKLNVSTGQYLPTDLSKFGVGMAGSGQAVSSTQGNGVLLTLPEGLSIVQYLCDAVISGTNTIPGGGVMQGVISSSPDGTTWTVRSLVNASGAVSAGAGSDSQLAIIFYTSSGTPTPTSTDVFQVSNIRILGTSVQEDAAGGFYGGTVLRDLMALVPGVGQRQIDAGTDFLIPSIERSVRDTVASVVAEVAGYYTREWAVWDGPAFQWSAVNLDEAQWVVENDQLQQGTRIQGSVDQLFRTVYVLFTEAASRTGQSVTAEQSAGAQDARNPLPKLGATKDKLVQAPSVMTDNTAGLLASSAAAQETYAPVNGTIVLNASALIINAVGSAQPAALIRAGSNIYLPGLPKYDSMLTQPRRDGQTLFHIVSTELDMEAGLVTLQVDGQANDSDVISARLAAVTRTVTG